MCMWLTLLNLANHLEEWWVFGVLTWVGPPTFHPSVGRLTGTLCAIGSWIVNSLFHWAVYLNGIIRVWYGGVFFCINTILSIQGPYYIHTGVGLQTPVCLICKGSMFATCLEDGTNARAKLIRGAAPVGWMRDLWWWEMWKYRWVRGLEQGRGREWRRSWAL